MASIPLVAMTLSSPLNGGTSGTSGSSGSRNGNRNSRGDGPLQPGPAVTPEQLRARFRDYDDRAVYEEVVAHALSEHALNVVVQFGNNQAQVACDLSEAEFALLLAEPDLFREGATPIRWINMWNLSAQRGTIEAIGRRYRFSRRLVMSIWAWDLAKKELARQKLARRAALLHPRAAAAPPAASYAGAVGASTGVSAGAAGAAAARSHAGLDLEAAADKMPYDGIGDEPAVRPLDAQSATENLATFRMMQGSLNYTSIDQEPEFVCVGANWLHRRPSGPQLSPDLVPPKHWSWLALCGDYSVLSLHEAVSFDKAPPGANEAEWRTATVQSVRSNTLKVLRQLSRWGLEEDQHKFAQLISVRQPGQPTVEGSLALEASSNLFYYLFEDYSAAVDILSKSKTALEAISSRILRTADWKNKEDTSDIIPVLYKLNKELRQLRHLFTNYKTLIDRLVSSDTETFGDGAVREKLSSKACNRFKRLRVQLQSLMLDAISDYLDEKKSLEDTYFSLITQKDSHSTERLTRSATLLAKLSVFFLPISFMTSYFSVQIPSMIDGYTARTYWGAFGVIASLSFLSLFFFSKVLMFFSERLEHGVDRVVLWASERAGWRRGQKAMRAIEAEEAL